MFGRPMPGRSAEDGAVGSRLGRITSWLLVGALVGQALHLGIIAWRLPLDYWDGYDYLTNALVLAGHDGTRLSCGYNDIRPPLVPLLLAVVLQGYAPAGEGTALWGPHFLAAALSVFAVAALYRLLRLRLSPDEALFGCALLAVNPLFIHYAPFVMTDIPAMLFVTAGIIAYLRARETGRWLHHGSASAALAAAMLAKYSAVPVLGSLGLFEILRVFVPNPAEKDATPHLGRRAWRLLTDARPWLIVAGSLLLFYLVQAAVIARTMPGQLTLWNILTSWRDATGGVVFPSDPWFELVAELSTAVSPLLIAVALLGMVRAALMRTAFDLVCLAWFWVVLAALTILVGHKEARYVFPVLPPLIYFIVTGLRDLWRGLVRLVRARAGEGLRSRRVPELLAGSLLLFFAARPASLAAREFGRFYDPVYARPFLQEVARWTLARTSPGQSVLVNPGFIYTMYPADPIFSPYDEYFYFHHINVCALSYFLDRPVMQTNLLREVLTGSVPFVERFAASQVMLVSTSPFFDTTSGRLPEPPLPMILTFAGRRTLRLDRGAPDRALYQAVDHPQDRVVLARQDATWEVVDGPTEAGWRFYQRKTAGGAVEPFERDAAIEPPARLELVRVEQRRVTFR